MAETPVKQGGKRRLLSRKAAKSSEKWAILMRKRRPQGAGKASPWNTRFGKKVRLFPRMWQIITVLLRKTYKPGGRSSLDHPFHCWIPFKTRLCVSTCCHIVGESACNSCASHGKSQNVRNSHFLLGIRNIPVFIRNVRIPPLPRL